MSPVTRTNSVMCSYEKFEPSYQDEKRQDLRNKTNMVKCSHNLTVIIYSLI